MAREAVWQALAAQRARTLALIAQTPLWSVQTDPEFSPVGWHLGHIGFTEALWLLEQAGARAPLFSDYRRLWMADGLPKHQRQQLPPFETVFKQLVVIREQVRDRLFNLSDREFAQEARLWQWLAQHEAQHAETIQIVQALAQTQEHGTVVPDVLPTPMQVIPTTTIWLGDDTSAVDNERPAQRVTVSTFAIDREPVSVAQYQVFIDAGGDRDRQWWCEAGWQWRNAAVNSKTSAETSTPTGSQTLGTLQPRHRLSPWVCGLSWYEAAAYARFVGKRLPTEFEWEAAARAIGTDWLGQVWQWTDSWFEPYPGFEAFPYRGYSAAYFKQTHRVLRGGSWASQAPVLHVASRNWYLPGARQQFGGLRCASDLDADGL